MDILSLREDSKHTLLYILDKLYSTFIVEQQLNSLVVVGDAKTYELLQALCKEYDNSLAWVLPFPGDWHTLFNYQKVLMKAYWEAGLYELGQVSGHRAETLKSLASGNNFKRSHLFLMQAYEAMFRVLISPFSTKLSEKTLAIISSAADRLNTVIKRGGAL
jgi:hypothetical protein